MTRTVYKTPRAQRDLIEHYAYIARDKAAPADRFLEVAQQTFQNLSEIPTIGRLWKSRLKPLAGIRVYPMPPPFRRYLIFYLYDAYRLEIVSVIHGARHLPALLTEIAREEQR